MTNISTSVGGRQFDSCLMNAAGLWCMTQAELDDLVTSQAATFVTKTATVEFRQGNPEPRYYGFGQSSINSMGLPNLSMDFYLEYLSKDSESNKRFLSMAPIVEGDMEILIDKIKAAGYQGMIELNLSCPNIPGKPQTGYDLDQSKKLLDILFGKLELQMGVKLPPYFDLVHFDQMAEVLNQYPLAFVTSVNSLGNGIVIKDLSVTTKPKNGFGGIGGTCIKPTALANVHAFRQRLNPEIKIMGAGGVANGRDVFEHILCGADMVQIGTLLYEKGPKVFGQLKDELKAEMIRYGYSSLEDFRNKLQYI